MALSEFEIIAKYFDKPGLSLGQSKTSSVPLGIGDDCALLALPEGTQLAISMDMLVADVHFPLTAEPDLIAERALRVNLSDLAAMGASPMCFTLGLALPEIDETWLAAFSDGLSRVSAEYSCPLVGGDLTKGSTTLCIQVHGYIEHGRELRRSGAIPGDSVYVTGTLGAAALALSLFSNKLPDINNKDALELKQSYYRPSPRLAAAKACCQLASAAIDISDGLLADLGHIADRSGVGMSINIDQVPLNEAVVRCTDKARALRLALGGGDDYELVFTVPQKNRVKFEQVLASLQVSATAIGKVVIGSEVICYDAAGEQVDVLSRGYQHF